AGFLHEPSRGSKEFCERRQIVRRVFCAHQKTGGDGGKSPSRPAEPAQRAARVSRRQILASAQAAARDFLATTIQRAEQRKFYDDHIDRYTQAKVKVLLVSFRAGGPLSEREAKAKAEKLLARVRSGADFVKLVKENSGRFPIPPPGTGTSVP